MYFFSMLLSKGNNFDQMLELIFPAVIIAIFGAIFLISRRRETVRTEKLATISQELGYPFQAAMDPERLERLGAFPLMNIGRGKKIENVISVDGPSSDIAMFDYRYVIGHGKSRRVLRQTVMSVESTSLVHPVFNLRPEGFWSKVSSFFGRQDIDFVEHPGFSEKYVLKGESEEEVRIYMDTILLDFFAVQDNICCEAREGTILYYHRYTRVAPDAGQLQKFMEEGLGVFEGLVTRQSRPGGRSA